MSTEYEDQTRGERPPKTVNRMTKVEYHEYPTLHKKVIHITVEGALDMCADEIADRVRAAVRGIDRDA